MTFTAAVIGLGNIGQGYDYDCRDGTQILTHAMAFDWHPGFELVAGVDPDSAARARFTAKFAKPTFASVGELWAAADPDVVALSVPTALHFKVFQQVMTHHPLAVICEKPLAVGFTEGEAMVEAARRAGCLLSVNYMRRFEPGVLALKERIESGALGRFYKGVQWYSKGVLTNGSHFVDLLTFLFGPANLTRMLQPGREYGEFDREPDVLVRFGAVEVYFLAAREECFSLRDLQLISDRAEVRYLTGGDIIEVRATQPHPFISGYTVLGESPERIATDLRRCQWHVAQGVYDALTGNAPLHSTGETALDTLGTVWKMMNAGVAEAVMSEVIYV